MTPVWRHCLFLNCPNGLFLARRRDTRYCSAVCRDNARAMRRGLTLRGTGVRGAAAVKYYRTLRATPELRRPAA